jgi:mono/diheme cytochrome c family protein
MNTQMKASMKVRKFLALAMCSVTVVCFAAADGSWLKKVPANDHAKVNPLAGNPEAIASGANLFANNCAKCHGTDGVGKGSRPTLKSGRIAGTTDGDLAWLLKNGNPYKGMPGWGALPEQERWQLVAYVRSLNAAPVAAPTGVQQ